jgi:predicted nucleotidyltransferase
MRLSIQEHQAIVDLFHQYFPGGMLYLFGSRVNDKASGGDIDLLCELDGDPAVLVKKKMLFLLDLDKAIGEQQVDFILHRPSISPHSTIVEVAKKTGVRLV